MRTPARARHHFQMKRLGTNLHHDALQRRNDIIYIQTSDVVCQPRHHPNVTIALRYSVPKGNYILDIIDFTEKKGYSVLGQFPGYTALRF